MTRCTFQSSPFYLKLISGEMELMAKLYSDSGVEIIELAGNIQQEESDELESLLYSLYEQGYHNIVVDLIKVTNICSAALALLVSFKQIFTEKRGDLKVVVESQQIHDLFKVTMLDRVFDTSDALHDAVAAFQK